MNWAQIFVTAIVTGLVTIATTLILVTIQSREGNLTYSRFETIPFPSDNQFIGIYQVSIENQGKREVEAVDVVLSVQNTKIEKWKIVANPAIRHSEKLQEGELSVNIPMLNPAESVQVLVLANSNADPPKQPDVSLRAKGIIGFERKRGGDRAGFLVLFPVLAALLGVTTGLFTWRYFRRIRSKISGIEDTIEGVHSDEQKYVLSYLCGIHGLEEEVARYSTLSGEVSYWAESDRLTTNAIGQKNKEVIEKAKHILQDLLGYAVIAEVSRGIIMYNLSRLAIVSSDKTEAIRLLTDAKRLAKKIIEKRIEIDPILRTIEKDTHLTTG